MATTIIFPMSLATMVASGAWLEEHMPNPPLPETQRFDIKTHEDGTWVIEFADEQDAIMFSLAWSS